MCAAGMPLAASAEQLEGSAHANLQETSTNSAELLEDSIVETDTAATSTSDGADLSKWATPAAPTETGNSDPTAADNTAAMQMEAEAVTEALDTPATEEVPRDRTTARLSADSAELSDLFRITDHVMEGRDTAILYIDYLPVFTFVAPAEPDSADLSKATTDLGEAAHPTHRAEAVARQIDAFYQAEGNPADIAVRWDEDLEEYVVLLADEPLVFVNNATYYFNTTGQHGTDALHATNRLRSLLGGAEALTEVEGEPEPEPEATVAVANWGVASTFSGQASWYGPGFHGRQTASGERFNQNALTAAHRTLPFGTRVRVINANNNREVIVRINDRGPFSHGRVIDLSAAAAREIGLHLAGVGPVRVEVLMD